MSIAVIFDMDGVLIDSPKYIIASFSKVLEPYGIKHGIEEHMRFNGMSLKSITEIWNKEHNLNLDILELSKRANEVELELMKNNSNTNNELIYFLNELKTKNIPVAVGTSSLKHRVYKLLEIHKLSSYFPVIVSAEDVTEHKPNPHVFLECAKRINMEPKNCIVFEDAPMGIEAARRAKMKVIAVKTEYHTNEELKEADLIINDFSEINLDIISKL